MRIVREGMRIVQITTPAPPTGPALAASKMVRVQSAGLLRQSGIPSAASRASFQSKSLISRRLEGLWSSRLVHSAGNFEAHLFRSSWDNFGIILESIRDRVGINLESIWDHLGIILGSFRDQFRIIWGILLGSFEDLRSPSMTTLLNGFYF